MLRNTIIALFVLAVVMSWPAALFADEAKGSFKEPVLVWERTFDPPLTEISAKNSAGEYLAVERRGEKGAYEWEHTRILFLDSKGQTVREIALHQKGKRTIPSDRVWVAFYGEGVNKEELKRKYKDGMTVETETLNAFVSGNGEYYAIVTYDTDDDTIWYEFAYYDRTGKLLWKFEPQDNYTGPEVHISYDGSRVLLIDKAEEDFFAQKWYLISREGKVLKSEDHNLMKAERDERDREAGDWIKRIDMSNNGEYIAYTKETKAGLMNKDGNVLWEKDFRERNLGLWLYSNGMVKVNKHYIDKTGGDATLNANNAENLDIDEKYWVYNKGKDENEELYITTLFENKVLHKLKATELIGGRTRFIWPKLLSEKYLLVFVSYHPEEWNITKRRSLVIIDLDNRKIVWRSDDLMFNSDVRFKAEMMLEKGYLIKKEREHWKEYKKITVFDVSKGDGT